MGAIYVYPVLLAGYEKYWKRKDHETFEDLVTLCFKYHVRVMVITRIFETKNYERKLYGVICDIYKGVSLGKIISDKILIGNEYPDDEAIKGVLYTKDFARGRQAQVLLEEVEYEKSDKISRVGTTVEHIMPKDHDLWNDYILTHNKEIAGKSPKQIINIIHTKHYRLIGNQTLLAHEYNVDAGKKSFEDKKIVYGKSPTYKITKELTEIPIWNVDEILKRHNRLIDIITKEIDLNPIRKKLDK